MPRNHDENLDLTNQPLLNNIEKYPLLDSNGEFSILNDQITYLAKFRQRITDKMI